MLPGRGAAPIGLVQTSENLDYFQDMREYMEFLVFFTVFVWFCVALIAFSHKTEK